MTQKEAMLTLCNGLDTFLASDNPVERAMSGVYALWHKLRSLQKTELSFQEFIAATGEKLDQTALQCEALTSFTVPKQNGLCDFIGGRSISEAFCFLALGDNSKNEIVRQYRRLRKSVAATTILAVNQCDNATAVAA